MPLKNIEMFVTGCIRGKEESTSDNKIFWKTVKQFLSNKGDFCKQITLLEGEKFISENKEVAEKLNNYFENAVKSLDISEDRIL